MGFLARPGFSFFVPFFHGHYPWAETIPQCVGYTADIFSVPFRLSFSEGKRERNPRKSRKRKRVHRLTAAIGKTLKYRINTGFKPKNNRKKKREWTDARDRKDDLKTRLKTKRLSLFQIYIEKRKRRRKEKRDAGEGKEKGTKMRSGVADGGRPEGK